MLQFLFSVDKRGTLFENPIALENEAPLVFVKLQIWLVQVNKQSDICLSVIIWFVDFLIHQRWSFGVHFCFICTKKVNQITLFPCIYAYLWLQSSQESRSENSCSRRIVEICVHYNGILNRASSGFCVLIRY